MEYVIKLGDTFTVPAREITEDLLRAKELWAREHNLPDAVNPNLQVGQLAKVLRAYVRVPRGFPEAVSATIADDGSSVAVAGVARGWSQVDVIDEISDPGGTTGIAGGIEFTVIDELDAQIMAAKQAAAPAEPAPTDEPAPPPAV